MQLYARQEKTYVLAVDAQKHKNYSCPECQGALRVRGGPHRKAHFYHIAGAPHCRQAGKSMAHLQTQLFLKQKLEESFLEYPFPSIGRIADVFWKKENTVFEIQCSSLSLSEAQKRCEDYTSLGLKVIWILHDKTFNKKNLSAAEAFLRLKGCFFTNFDDKGRGLIYDQFELVQKNRRLFWGHLLEIDPLRLHLIQPQSSTEPPGSQPIQKPTFSFKKGYHILLRFLLENLSS